MVVSFFEIYFVSFLAVAISYSFLASWAKIFYRKKTWGQLSANELKVKQGTATLENRVDLFARTFFTSLFTYQVHLIALAVSIIVLVISNWLIQ